MKISLKIIGTVSPRLFRNVQWWRRQRALGYLISKNAAQEALQRGFGIASIRKLTVVCILCTFISSVAIAAGAPTLLTRSIQKHEKGYHPSHHDMFNALVAPSIGGVIARSSVVGPSGETDFVLSLPSDTEYSGVIAVSFGSRQAQLSIDYDLLVRAALFADGGRTGLYTYWDESHLVDGFARRAGFVAASRGMVAIEFNAPKYIRTLYRADLHMDSCLGLKDDPLRRTINRDLEAESSNPAFTHAEDGSSYIVTDLGGSFALSTAEDKLDLSGTLRRFYWRAEAGEAARIDKVEVYEMELCSKADAATLKATEELFGVIALLRSARSHSSSDYDHFMEALAANSIIEANPGPWLSYTETARVLYPELNE